MVKQYICASFLLGLILFAPLYAVESAVIGSKSVIPDFFFQIPIPGLSLTSADILAGTAVALYAKSVHIWLVGFAAALAVLALTWGGVRWLLSGGESGKIQEAKKVISNALIGLLLALGSYTLLATIGKDYVNFRPLHVESINPIELNACWADKSTAEYLAWLMGLKHGLFRDIPDPVKIAGFAHLKFNKGESSYDIEFDKKYPTPGRPIINPATRRLLNAVDAAGFNVLVETLSAGSVMGCEYKGIRKARDEGRYVRFYVKDESTLIRLAAFIKNKQHEFPMEYLSMDHLVEPIQKCLPADDPHEIKDSKFDAVKRKFPGVFFHGLWLIVGCESPGIDYTTAPPPTTTITPPTPPTTAPPTTTIPPSTTPIFVPPTVMPHPTP